MHFLHYLALLGVSILCHGCLLPEEINNTSHVERRQNNDGTVLIGDGDRWAGGTVAPRGLGSQPPGTTIDTAMNVVEIQSAVQALANQFGIEFFTTPESTHEGATMFGGKVGNGLDCNDAYRVYLMAGIHARERGGPDNLIYFISDLLWAQSQNTGLTYGGKTYSNADVLTALDTGIVFMPLSNPDGVAYDHSTNSCWRHNRNPDSPVDLNRNFDFLWDCQEDWYPGISLATCSDIPGTDTYHGKSRFSEPETRNVKWVMDEFKQLRWQVDLHSYLGQVLYSWGSDTNQASRPDMTFNNPAFSHTRGAIPDQAGAEYGEYITFPDWDASIIASVFTADGMSGVEGRYYSARQAIDLYPTAGASSDYAFARAFADSSLSKIYGFTIEFGFAGPGTCSFYPTVADFNTNIRETGAGFMEFLLSAHRLGLGSPRVCPPDSVCAATCVPQQCGARATCEYFNPINGAPSFGNSYCFCQAGYKATGVADTDTDRQYHLTWVNGNGDQTHRVLVNPGQDCWDVCGDAECSEVLLKDSCR
jgi:hypothetical protein